MNPNYQKAFEYYYEACNFGIPEAYIHLGNMYKNVDLILYRVDMSRGTMPKQSNISKRLKASKAAMEQSSLQVVAISFNPVTIEGVDLSFICKHLFAVFQIVYD